MVLTTTHRGSALMKRRKWRLDRELSKGPLYVWFEDYPWFDVYWVTKKEFWRG